MRQQPRVKHRQAGLVLLRHIKIIKPGFQGLQITPAEKAHIALQKHAPGQAENGQYPRRAALEPRGIAEPVLGVIQAEPGFEESGDRAQRIAQIGAQLQPQAVDAVAHSQRPAPIKINGLAGQAVIQRIVLARRLIVKQDLRQAPVGPARARAGAVHGLIILRAQQGAPVLAAVADIGPLFEKAGAADAQLIAEVFKIKPVGDAVIVDINMARRQKPLL